MVLTLSKARRHPRAALALLIVFAVAAGAAAMYWYAREAYAHVEVAYESSGLQHNGSQIQVEVNCGRNMVPFDFPEVDRIDLGWLRPGAQITIEVEHTYDSAFFRSWLYINGTRRLFFTTRGSRTNPPGDNQRTGKTGWLSPRLVSAGGGEAFQAGCRRPHGRKIDRRDGPAWEGTAGSLLSSLFTASATSSKFFSYLYFYVGLLLVLGISVWKAVNSLRKGSGTSSMVISVIAAVITAAVTVVNLLAYRQIQGPIAVFVAVGTVALAISFLRGRPNSSNAKEPQAGKSAR